MAEEEEGKKGEAAEASGEAGQAAGGSKKKLIILAVVVTLFVLLVGGAVMAFLLLRGGDEAEILSSDAAQLHKELFPEGFSEEDEYDEDEEPLGAFFPMDTFVVNLSGGRYIRLQVQLEFKSREVPRRFLTRTVLVRDALIALLTNRTPDDVDDPKGKEVLKEDIKETVNKILKREEVVRVYFTNFVVQ